ncbi:hypothetical protein [uncultured Helicobacter sp.]|uniref:HdrB C-terminal domain-containing protein n=1 Tax=uncultured Helicobacter sp. TaxID=175537 RepID=UPI0026228879|nr:hypothetical protein [uncultured Helicobacter sp.]
MESYILLQNNFYPSSKLLTHHIKALLEKLHISIANTQSLMLDDKFLPFIAPVDYYAPLVRLLDNAYKDEKKVLVYDSQSLLVITKLLKNLYENVDFREEISKSCACSIDILNLENSFVFAPEVLFDKIKNAEIKHRRWEGFKCAFIIDRELEERVLELQLISRIENVTGLKILPFFKNSYAYLLQSNLELAYKMGAMDYYEMVDCGVDFILNANLGNFELMDQHTKALQNASGRDTAEVPLLFVPQVVLALFMDANAESLKFSTHKIQPQML